MAAGPLPMFNAGYADREGNIYYVYNGRIPVRAKGDTTGNCSCPATRRRRCGWITCL